MFTIILVESSLELIPAELSKHQSVLAYSKKFKKNISNTLLDNSWHFVDVVWLFLFAAIYIWGS